MYPFEDCWLVLVSGGKYYLIIPVFIKAVKVTLTAEALQAGMVNIDLPEGDYITPH